MIIQTYTHNIADSNIELVDYDNISTNLQAYNAPITSSFKRFKKYFSDYLSLNGWSDKIRIDHTSNITIPSLKSKTGLSLQTGNCARFYSDMMKFQLMYDMQRINSLIYIVPMNRLAVKINTNTINFERIAKELPLFSNIINMPINIIGFDNEEII